MTAEAINQSASQQVLKPFPKRLKRLVWLLQSRKTLTAGVVRASIRAANIRLDELLPWVELSHSAWASYGESCLYSSSAFEIVVRTWAPGDFSAIHANDGLIWEVVQCFGAMEFYSYTLQGETLRANGKKQVSPGAILQMGGGAISQMGNMGQLPAIALHIRHRDRASKTAKASTRIFDLFSGTVQETNEGEHFSVSATQPIQSSVYFSGDWKTRWRYYQQLRDRLQRILDGKSPNVEALREKLNIVEGRIAILRASVVA